MATALPSRLLTHDGVGNFRVFDPRQSPAIEGFEFDIISYRWGAAAEPYRCDVEGADWDVTISKHKLDEIKALMVTANIQYLWADCVCINQGNQAEKAREIAQMYEYYMAASRCHILLDMDQVWNPQYIVDNLRLVGHIITNVDSAELVSASRLGEAVSNRLSTWANEEPWSFPVSKMTAQSAGVDLGLLNCYSTSIKYVKSVFRNLYFTRVWTFQEMLLGKNITMWGVVAGRVDEMQCIGALSTWMDLAIEATDKALKLYGWIDSARVVRNPGSVNAILSCITEDNSSLGFLQTQVKGLNSARTDIIAGGPHWWLQNYKGISNVFSAVSITPRECSSRPDIFRGLLGIFSGLFTAEEISAHLSSDDMDAISFAFFKQLSIKTGLAWTRLAISSGEREGGFNWIPVVPANERPMTTDLFSGVVKLGVFKPKGSMVKAIATTGLIGMPWKYMKISLQQNQKTEKNNFYFNFRGCNCGKKLRTGKFFGTEDIPTHDEVHHVVGDQTGRVLAQCATVLASIMDPASDVVEYRKRLLYKLLPLWTVTDRNAKPPGWVDRCVSGTPWESPKPEYIRVHNMSMNYKLGAIYDCQSRLHNDSTKDISCEVVVNCGCRISGPFSLIFEALTAVQGSFLGKTTASLDKDSRIELSDGLGLVQVGDVGKAFDLVAFGGNAFAHRTYAKLCRKTRDGKPVIPKKPMAWPTGRALVKEEFHHGVRDSLTRNYGYVNTEGSGNLLICRNNPLGNYKIIGVCIDNKILSKSELAKGEAGERQVTIQ